MAVNFAGTRFYDPLMLIRVFHIPPSGLADAINIAFQLNKPMLAGASAAGAPAAASAAAATAASAAAPGPAAGSSTANGGAPRSRFPRQ